MRLKSDIWVASLLRRCSSQGYFGAVIHHGADEAGVIFIYINHLNGTYDLLAPPPGPAYDENGERRFVKECDSPAEWAKVSGIVEKRRKSDPDLWAVEIEDRNGLAGIAIATENFS